MLWAWYGFFQPVDACWYCISIVFSFFLAFVVLIVESSCKFMVSQSKNCAASSESKITVICVCFFGSFVFAHRGNKTREFRQEQIELVRVGLWDTPLKFLSPGPCNDITDHLEANHYYLLLKSTSRSQDLQCQEFINHKARPQVRRGSFWRQLLGTNLWEQGGKSTNHSLSLDESDGLIGTSKECQEYFEDLEKVVKASLEADKEQVKEEGKQILIRCLIRIKQFQEFMTGSVLYPLHRNISVWLLFHV